SASYAALLEDLYAAVAAYLRKNFGALPMLDDCVQESLIALHRARHSYDAKRPFRPWLFTIVRHKAVDFLRRAHSRDRGEAERRAVDEPRGDDAAERFELQLDTSRFLTDLNPAHREALILTKLQGHSVSEAARVAGISSTAMRSRVHRALRLARRALERSSP
ncbi:MAG: RNA polymerase sigma factor, partial [Myxococcales bacterium]|nr:RNA polymerase sigma factor [Myxococcales bacterium]